MKLRKTPDDLEEDNILDDDEEDLDFKEDDNYGDINDGLSTMDRHNDLLKELTEFDSYLKTKVTEWLGLVWSEQETKYVLDKSVDPIMNLKGARWCINFLRPYCRKNNIITSLDKDTYQNMMDDVITTAITNIGTRYEEFEIKSYAEMMSIWNQLIHSVELVLIGAGGSNNYKEMITTTTSRNENMNLNNQPNQQQNLPPKQSYLDKAKKIVGLR